MRCRASARRPAAAAIERIVGKIRAAPTTTLLALHARRASATDTTRSARAAAARNVSRVPASTRATAAHNATAPRSPAPAPSTSRSAHPRGTTGSATTPGPTHPRNPTTAARAGAARTTSARAIAAPGRHDGKDHNNDRIPGRHHRSSHADAQSTSRPLIRLHPPPP
jgi:hypothetical protein